MSATSSFSPAGAAGSSPSMRVRQRAVPRISVVSAPTFAATAGEAKTAPSSRRPAAASAWSGSSVGISSAALKGSRPIRRATSGVSPMRTRVSMTGASTATASSRASWSISASGTWPAPSRGAITASGSPCTAFMAWAKSASAAALIRWIA
jgi:hypothetical protein